MWNGTRTLVTGGRGFLGSHVVARLTALGADPVAVGSKEADLTNFDETLRLFESVRPTVVVHCAVQGGGIGVSVREVSERHSRGGRNLFGYGKLVRES